MNRIGDMGQLTVQSSRDTRKRSASVEGRSGGEGYTVFNVPLNPVIYVGGTPGTPNAVLRSKKFFGCLHSLIINNEKIGLWNFFTPKETIEDDSRPYHCNACLEG